MRLFLFWRYRLVCMQGGIFAWKRKDKNMAKNSFYTRDKQEVKAITDQLEEGLKELFAKEKYKSYLSMMSKFHNYSANNIQLITMQCPDATFVAGYKAWQNDYNRHVKRHEEGIRILAPAPYTVKKERDKVDPVTGEIMLDRDGMPQKEEVEIRIPAFRVVHVYDVSQTEGEPIQEPEVKELLSSVEGYEDFIKAVSYVAPVPVGFEDIPGDARGYFRPSEKRIAVQEGMSESQTIKTMLHETAHAMLHDREVNSSNGQNVPAKDKRTKEVEAESIAYTVCKHFGIDTSEYSFGYIAGWSSGKNMKELKSSLDTIRRTASELIMGIEGQLFELQRDRELMQEQDKESLLLIQNSDLSEYSLLNVRGMDAAEIVEALSAMIDDDRLSIAAYLESKGAWTTEIANEETREFGEYHLDVRYYTDTNEIINLKTEMEFNERAKEPIGANDVILKIAFAAGFEVERITNKTPEEVQEIMAALTKLEDRNTKNIRDCLNSFGADYIPISVSGGRNSVMPQFNDFEIDLDKKEVTMMSHLSPAQQAEGIINRLEYAKTAFSSDERDLIVNYAYKLNNMEKTRELAEHIYYEEAEGNQGAALAVIDAQAEIDALPDPMIGLSEMEEYGYTWEEMLPLTKETALELFDRDLPVYQLHKDGSETLIEGREQITEYEHEGIFGIERKDWEHEKVLRALQKEFEEGRAEKEEQLLHGDSDRYGIYQLKERPELRGFYFAGTAELLKRNLLSDDFREIQPENYNLVYAGELSELQGKTQGATLEEVYRKFNIDHPADYKGHSLSVSDIVVLHENGKNSAHFVDSVGFTGLPDFMRKLEGVKEQEMTKEETKTYPPLYRQPITYAVEHGEKDAYRKSWELNQDCKKAVEEAVSRNFDGMHLDKGAVKPVLKEYGAERLAFILANTLKQEEWDARFSRDNVAWATDFFNSENMDYGAEGNVYLSLSSHPAVLDGFIDMFRREVMEQEKELSAGQEKLTSGHDVQKLVAEQPEQTQQLEQEPEQSKQSEAAQPETEQAEQNEPGQPSETPDEDMDEDDGDEIIDLGDEKDQVLAEMKKSLMGEQETELAFQIADRFISIQETEGGYDYSIMGTDYKEIDGGVYDNPDVTIREALNDIVTDLKENPFDNGARGNIRDSDELIPVDYEELMERVEAADRIEPQAQEDVVADFRAKTNELFHKIGKSNPAEIEETVKCHVQAEIDEAGIDAEIVDAVVVGSRCRGLELEGSDLDVVVELSTSEREDVLFDTFNGDALHIGGVKVDINPITAQRTGTLETYLPQVEDYLEGVREAREKEPVSIFNIRMNDEERWFKNTSGLDAEGLCKAYAECDKPFVEMGKYGEWIKAADHASIEQGDRLDFSIEFNEETDQITIFDGENFEYKGLRETLFPEQAEPEVTLTVAECGEYHNLGEFYENIPTVEEAVAIWKQIPPERMHGIPAIGIHIHTPGTEPIEDTGIDILSGRRIDLDILEYIPDIKGNPQAMEVIAELVAKVTPLIPDMEIDGMMSEEMEAQVWEKRMPDLTQAEQLAVEIDRFVYAYDTDLYRGGIQNMTEGVAEITEALEQRDTHDIALWLADIAADGTVPEEKERALELLEKLTEYKPLAKVEEMEEQNYNMVDNILNNGAGEKAQKEENKRMQEQPARPSLKARLAEKKAQVAGKGREQEENQKNNQREI